MGPVTCLTDNLIAACGRRREVVSLSLGTCAARDYAGTGVGGGAFRIDEQAETPLAEQMWECPPSWVFSSEGGGQRGADGPEPQGAPVESMQRGVAGPRSPEA
jgi:hypothetical protein